MSFQLEKWIRPHLKSLQGYVPGIQPPSGKFIKLNTNENPYPPSSKAIAASQIDQHKFAKYPDPTASSFRRIAAQIHNTNPENILCGNGSDEILSLLIKLFIEPNDIVRWPHPTYMLYDILVRMAGGEPDPIPFEENWSLAGSFFQGNPKLIFLANPNSPSGTCFSLKELSTILSKSQCPVVVDEAYADFAEQSAADLLEEHPNLIVTRTLSKSYGLAGIRFGYVMASQKVIALLHAIRDSYNCDAISISVATAALMDQAWLKENIQKVNKTKVVLFNGLQELGFRCTKSEANFVWCQHPSGKDEWIFQELLKRQIVVRYLDYGSPWIGLRISVGTDQQNEILLDNLSKILSELPD